METENKENVNALNPLRNSLLAIVDSIDSGNSTMNTTQMEEVLSLIDFMSRSNVKYSKYQALKYLNLKRSTFDLYVAQGLIPQGRQQQGFKEIFWLKSDLDKYKNACRI